MPENEKQPTPRDAGEGAGTPAADGQQDVLREEYRSLTTAIAAVTIPAATVLKPVATAWANQKFQTDGESKDSAPPPQQRPKDD
jgi:hypothetical protein